MQNVRSKISKSVFVLVITSAVLSLPGTSLAMPGQGGAPAIENSFGDRPDAFAAPDLPQVDMLSAATVASVAPGYYQTSEYMAGSVAVGIVLLESDGSVDPSTEDWTPAQKQLVFEKITAALDWWAALEPRAHLSFIYEDHVTVPLPTGVEPISRPRSDQKLWIADAMGALGYQADSFFTRVRDYDNDLRARHHTDWAFTIFIVNSERDADNSFSDGYFAYAYLGGPFMVMTYGNGGNGPDRMDVVAAHEIGHIFYALDQYAAAGQPCASRSGYLDVENQNSQSGQCAINVSSIMRGGSEPYLNHAIDPYAAGQIGWQASHNDNILDPLHAELPVTLTAASLVGSQATLSGTATIIPYPSSRRPSVTINTLVGVQYRLDDGDWQAAAPADGAFDTRIEQFSITVAALAPGLHTVEAAALDSAGNVSRQYAAQTIAVPDPFDGGLITTLFPKNSYAAGKSTMTGIAFQFEGGAVVNVQYRLDGGAWQPAVPQDGAFDGSQEAFSFTLDFPELGSYLVEARAVDASGKAETTWASEWITVTHRTHLAFLPVIAR